MRRASILLVLWILLLSCSNEPKKLVDVSMPKGTIFSDYDKESNDSIYFIVTDTIHQNDSIISHIERLVCNVYESFKPIIHKGEFCRTNNSVAVALARQEGNMTRVKELLKENADAESKGAKAKIELQNHLDTCKICKRIKNKYYSEI